MQLSLLKGNYIFDCVLPEKQKGQYWITQQNQQGYEEKVLSVEGNDEKWVLKSNRNAYLLDDNNQRIKEKEVEASEVYRIFLRKTNETVLLYAEPLSEDRKVFKKLLLPAEGKLLIGRSEECDIRYECKYASSRHAELIITGQSVMLRNLSKANGTYVNGEWIIEKQIKPGDVIYIIGLKIIVGQGFIAVNNPDGLVSVNHSLLGSFKKAAPTLVEDEFDDIEDEEISSYQTFYRSPRFKRDIETVQIKIDEPPALGNLEDTPLLLVLGPAMTMGMASLVTGLFSFQNAMSRGNIMFAIPTLVMSISMLIGMILFPILMRRYDRRKRLNHEEKRQERYKEYLSRTRQEIIHECRHQSEILHENFITVDECADRIRTVSSKLWERTREQNDFLKLRVGLGNLPLQAEIKYPEKKFSIEDDNLKDELYRLAQEPKELVQVPITISLTEDRVSGIIGNRERVINTAKNLIIQLTSLHSYDELKLVFLYDKKEQDTWDFVKWFPHVWNKEEGIRYLATNPSEVRELSTVLEKELTKREEIHDSELNEVTPYYVIFAIDKNLAVKAEMINTIYKQKKNTGFSVIHLYDELVSLPKECTLVIDIDAVQSRIYNKNDISGQFITVQPEEYRLQDEEKLAKTLANVQLMTAESEFTLPNMLTFLEMFEVGKVEHLNALTRWKENDPTTNLETRIGVDTNGQWFYLDLHEKFHGPHGLIAGMTGSGKSEFIMTFILSLAVNYHPDEVAFILIDYKGGGMAHTFTNLPHLAGTITNLDGAAVNRSLISIQSELKRRQAVFNEASKKLDVSNIDIYKYQKLYREGKVSEPLQHLFIISDEFAELKTQQPEFMEQLVSAARIGRSLGIHLILATQKPSGVVDDQIWSNSKFRISLKVQEKSDSMDVIKRPDAAELSVTGRFYLQVGYNEFFGLGQSAWGGAPYYPSDRIEKIKDESVAVIDNLGRTVKQVKLDKRKGLVANPPKQMDEVTKYLANIAKEEQIKIRRIWLDPIPALIYIDELKQKYKTQSARYLLNPIIGELDDPVNQQQKPLHFPLSNEGNAIIYGTAGSGKTTFLNTLIYSLMEEHTPEEVHLYLLDFGAETLRAFATSPHVGDVLLSHEAEKLTNLFKMLYKEVDRRKKLFADYGGDYQAYIKSTNEALPSLVVVIHNYSGFAETYDDKEEAVGYLAREGLKYGIYFIVTGNNPSAVRYRIAQNFKQLFVLQLNDQSDYSAALGNVGGVYPSKHKGRGIYKTDRVYEFQIAHAFQETENSFERIKQYCAQYSTSWKGSTANRIPILPDKIDIDFLANEIQSSPESKTPVGVEKNSLQIAYYDFSKSYINLVLAQSFEQANFIQGLTEVIAEKGDSTIIVIDPDSMYLDVDQKKYEYFTAHSDLDQLVNRLFATLVERNNTYKDAKESGATPPCFVKTICVVHSLTSFKNKISPDSQEKLKILLEKGEVEYNVHFIISDSIANISSVSFEPWFKTKVSLHDGIWVGNGLADQFQLKVKVSRDLYQEIGEEFGYTIANGKPTLIKLVSSVKSESLSLVEV